MVLIHPLTEQPLEQLQHLMITSTWKFLIQLKLRIKREKPLQSQVYLKGEVNQQQDKQSKLINLIM